MVRRSIKFLFSFRYKIIFIAAVALLAVCANVVRFRPYWHFEGIYVFKGENSWLEIKDDTVLGDEDRLLLALPVKPVLNFLQGGVSHAAFGNQLKHEWFNFDGSGYVESRFVDGTRFLACFSRFLDSGARNTRGVFVGGKLSYDQDTADASTLNDTGVSFYDGTKWHHLWCNVNESIAPWSNPSALIPPSSWHFLGSSVAKNSPEEIVITSSHQVNIDGVPFRIDRVASFKAGTRYFTLAIRVSNIGGAPGGYYYVYGDEPWVSNYGTSEGNVGWVRDRLVAYEEALDPREHRWAGYFDYGNEAAGEKHIYSGIANFIEWKGNVTPDLVYFSNQIGTYAPPGSRVPLNHPDSRVLFLQWGPRLLDPGQSNTIILSIGMADRDPATGFPVKPDTSIDLAHLETFLPKISPLR